MKRIRQKCIHLSVAVGILAAVLSACRPADVPTATASPVPMPTVPFPVPPTDVPATPTPTPVTVTFTEDAGCPLPEEHGVIAHNKPYSLRGTVTSNVPLTSVSVFIVCDFNENDPYPMERTVTFHPSDGVLSYALSDPNTVEGVSLDALTPFSSLGIGHHTLYLFVSTADSDMIYTPVSREFDVLGDTWRTFTADAFSNGSYKTALAFFGGDESRFLYRYQVVSGRYVIADPAWERTYLTEFSMDDGEPWRIHIDALPNYRMAKHYLDKTFFRVSGTNGDTGVRPLCDCIVSYSGSYCSRFTSSKRYISHHAFACASDINATLEPNRNKKENIALIETEVRSNLVYNGIRTDGSGQQYYDFTYSGAYETTASGIPETVINYLLYELCFYRAGFQWGHYYHSTSDAMHFTLTDNLAGRHDAGERALRKVFSYID